MALAVPAALPLDLKGLEALSSGQVTFRHDARRRRRRNDQRRQILFPGAEEAPKGHALRVDPHGPLRKTTSS